LRKRNNNYLSVYGNLNDIANIIKSKGTSRVSKHTPNNKSLSELENKLSENISHSELSQRHDSKVGNFMNNESRNYPKDGRHVSRTSLDGRNKSIDKLNQSKDIDKVGDRLSKLEILQQDTEQSFSHKGPIMIK